MGRPRKEGLDYFPHDVYLSVDSKVQALEALTGVEGYAFYLKLLEVIYHEGPSFKVAEWFPKVFGVQKMHWPAELSEEKFHTLIGYCLKLGLFCTVIFKNSRKLTSDSIKRRAKVIQQKRIKSRAKVVSASETPQKSVRNTTETPERKGKERKGKESKGKEIDHSLPIDRECPPADDVLTLPPPEPLTKYGTILAMTESQMAKCVEKYGQPLVDQEKPEADLWLQHAITPNARKYRKPGYNHYLFFRTTWLADKKLKTPGPGSVGHDERAFAETSRRWLEKEAHG